MNKLQIFNNPEFGEIRAIEIDGEPWFVGKDVAAALGYTNPRKAVADHVDDEDKGVTKCDTLGGTQEMTIINESGVYSLVLSSKLKRAKALKRWVTAEVIPSIRKHGSYAMNRPPMSAAELIAAQANLLVEHESELSALAEETKAIRRGVEAANSRIVDAVNVFSATSFSPDTWQEEANRQINEIVEAHKLNHQSYRSQLYERLERISGVNLQSRQTRMRNRMKAQGKTRRQQNAVTKLYIIAQDKQLRLIFDSILREEKAKRICAGWGA